MKNNNNNLTSPPSLSSSEDLIQTTGVATVSSSLRSTVVTQTVEAICPQIGSSIEADVIPDSQSFASTSADLVSVVNFHNDVITTVPVVSSINSVILQTLLNESASSSSKQNRRESLQNRLNEYRMNPTQFSVEERAVLFQNLMGVLDPSSEQDVSIVPSTQLNISLKKSSPSDLKAVVPSLKETPPVVSITVPTTVTIPSQDPVSSSLIQTPSIVVSSSDPIVSTPPLKGSSPIASVTIDLTTDSKKTIASKSAASRRVFLEGSASIIPPSRNKIDNDEINNDNDLVSDDEDSSASVKSASSIIEPVPDLFIHKAGLNSKGMKSVEQTVPLSSFHNKRSSSSRFSENLRDSTLKLSIDKKNTASQIARSFYSFSSSTPKHRYSSNFKDSSYHQRNSHLFQKNRESHHQTEWDTNLTQPVYLRENGKWGEDSGIGIVDDFSKRRDSTDQVKIKDVWDNDSPPNSTVLDSSNTKVQVNNQDLKDHSKKRESPAHDWRRETTIVTERDSSSHQISSLSQQKGGRDFTDGNRASSSNRPRNFTPNKRRRTSEFSCSNRTSKFSSSSSKGNWKEGDEVNEEIVNSWWFSLSHPGGVFPKDSSLALWRPIPINPVRSLVGFDPSVTPTTSLSQTLATSNSNPCIQTTNAPSVYQGMCNKLNAWRYGYQNGHITGFEFATRVGNHDLLFLQNRNRYKNLSDVEILLEGEANRRYLNSSSDKEPSVSMMQRIRGIQMTFRDKLGAGAVFYGTYRYGLSILEVERDMSRATSVNQLLGSSYFRREKEIIIPDWLARLNDYNRDRYNREREAARLCEPPLRFATHLSRCPARIPEADPHEYIPVYGQVFHGFRLWWEVKLTQTAVNRPLFNAITTSLIRHFLDASRLLVGLEEQWYYIPNRFIDNIYPEDQWSIQGIKDKIKEDALQRNRLYLRGVCIRGMRSNCWHVIIEWADEVIELEFYYLCQAGRALQYRHFYNDHSNILF